MNHALPLIPPSDVKMTMTQCDAEIKLHEKAHRAAIDKFWGELKDKTKPDPTWSQTQLDLHRLFHCRKKGVQAGGFKSPDHEYVAPIWAKAISQLDDDIQAELEMSTFADFDLVAIITEGDDVTLVHRYEGSELNNVSENDLDISNSDGPGWYYRSYHYSPEGFRGSPYSVACLYVIGTIDRESGDWVPRGIEPDSFEFSALSDVAEDMEALIEHGKISDWKANALPAFHSGVEVRLRELQLLRTAMIRKAITKSDDERDRVKAAVAPFDESICALRSQIETLEDALKTQETLKAKAQLQAFLASYGFEPGQVVVHTCSGESGALTISDDPRPMIYVHIEGAERLNWRNQHSIEGQIRVGEWTRVEDGNQPRPVERMR